MDQDTVRRLVKRTMKKEPDKLGIALRNLLLQHKNLSFLEGNKKQILKIILSNILNDARATPPRLENIASDTGTLTLATHHSDRSFCQILWTKGRVTIMSSAFEAISKASLRYSCEIKFSDAWHGCLTLLLQAGKIVDGMPFFVHAIHEGLLRNFVVYSPGIAPPSNIRLRSLLHRNLKTLQVLLPIGPVLSAVEKALGGISKDLHEKVVNSANGVFWRDFVHFFVERLVLKCYYDQSRRTYALSPSICYTCKIESKTPLKTCSGCKIAKYCSRQCQRLSWMGHKDDCHNLRKNYKLGFSTNYFMSTDDSLFLVLATAQDSRRHEGALRAMASRKYPKRSFNDLATVVDYTCFPPTLTVTPLSIIKDETRKYSDPRIEIALENAYYSNGKSRLFKLCYLNCGTPMVHFDAYSGLPIGGDPLVPYSLHATKFVDSLGNPMRAGPAAVDELMGNCKFTPDSLFSTSFPVYAIRMRISEYFIADSLDAERKGRSDGPSQHESPFLDVVCSDSESDSESIIASKEKSKDFEELIGAHDELYSNNRNGLRELLPIIASLD